jgi:isopentenyl-diphosphate Delta-isomerase
MSAQARRFRALDRRLDPPPILIPAILPDGRLVPMEKMEAHRKGQLHLAVSVFVFAGARLLIQRRASSKYHCAGQWANTCCTHPAFGESPDDAAQRRLMEELGFAVPLVHRRVVEYRAEVGNGLVEHERVHMFIGEADPNRIVVFPDPEEVEETRWIDAANLRAEIAGEPEAFTPWFRIYLERFPELRL